MILTEELKIKIKEHALLDKNSEACGLILMCHKTKKPIIFNCRNDAPDKKRYFSLNPHDYLSAKNRGLVTAYYHSHPSGNPTISEFDKINAENHKLKCIVYSLFTNIFNEYSPQNYRFKYIGRKFEIGKNDCYSLVKDYFKHELNINLGEYHRQEGWIKFTPNIFEDNGDIQNFDKIQNLNECQKNDILLFKFYNHKFPTHCCVLLENKIILNHDRNQYSCIEKISDYYKSKFMYGLRYKFLC